MTKVRIERERLGLKRRFLDGIDPNDGQPLKSCLESANRTQQLVAT